MKSKEILKKISSKYVILIIFDYIKDINFKYKLLNHSKSFQKIIDIQLNDIKSIFLINNIYKNDSEYLHIEKEKYKTNALSDNLNKFLSKNRIDKNIINNNNIIFEKIINYFITREEEILNNNNTDIFINPYSEKIIDIYSPFFEIFSKSKLFHKKFSIFLDIDYLANSKVAKDYILIFEKMNNSNIEYSSLTIYENKFDYSFDILCKIKIDLNKIKRLTINSDHKFIYTLFSQINIQNNLIYLNLSPKYRIDSDSLKDLNEFKALKFLRLDIIFEEKTFGLKLSSLEYLYLDNCKNITFAIKTYPNLKVFKSNGPIMKSNLNCLVIMPELQKLILNYLYPQKFYLKLNFYFLEKLQYFEGEIDNFLQLNSPYLKEVNLFYLKYKSRKKDREKYKNEELLNNINKMYEKLISLKKLEKIYLKLRDTDNFCEIENAKGENNYVKELSINCYQTEYYHDFNVSKLQKKFPNLSTLNIELNYSRPRFYFVDDESDKLSEDDDDDEENIYEKYKKLPSPFIIIGQDNSCNLVNISIKINDIKKKIIKLNCKAFENLINVKFILSNKVNDI